MMAREQGNKTKANQVTSQGGKKEGGEGVGCGGGDQCLHNYEKKTTLDHHMEA